MEIKLFKPKDSLLQKYIECFYTINREQDAKPITYLTFPSIFTIVSVNTNSSIQISGNKVTLKYSAAKSLETYLTYPFIEPVWVEYQGQTNEITTYFKPLGINAFLKKPLSFYYKTQYPSFEPFADYKSKMHQILLIQDYEKKVEELEKYWVSKFSGFSHPFLHNVVSKIIGGNSLETLSEMALDNNVSRATINKHFAHHLYQTPSQLKKISRFRTAIKEHLSTKCSESLTEITYKTNYFDQSHMVKEFRALTSLAPKHFFSKISWLEDSQINWLFL
jgi:AraC-like DNA-binding protein